MNDEGDASGLAMAHGDGDDAQKIAENIRRLRTAAGMSQGQLADAMRDAGQGHWRQTTVSRVERAKQSTTMGEHEALEKILGPEVIDGTSLQRSLRKIASATVSMAVMHRVQRVEDALQEANEAMGELREMLEVTHWSREREAASKYESPIGEEIEELEVLPTHKGSEVYGLKDIVDEGTQKTRQADGEHQEAP